MSMAFEITTDDLSTILGAHGITKTDDELDALMDDLDLDAAEDAALAYCEMDNQTTSAYDEIENELMASGVIVAKDKKYKCDDIDESDCDPDEDDDELEE